MARIELVPEVLDDFERFFDHIARFEVPGPSARILELVQAINILKHSPLIGRPVAGGKRELLVGQKSRGYVALYRYIASIETVFILAIRSQSESGQKRTP